MSTNRCFECGEGVGRRRRFVTLCDDCADRALAVITKKSAGAEAGEVPALPPKRKLKRFHFAIHVTIASVTWENANELANELGRDAAKCLGVTLGDVEEVVEPVAPPSSASSSGPPNENVGFVECSACTTPGDCYFAGECPEPPPAPPTATDDTDAR